MSALIRSGLESGRVRALPERAGVARADPGVDERAALTEAREALALALAERDSELAAARAEIAQAHARGLAEGRKTGLAEADEGREARLAALQAAASRALSAQGDQMRVLEHAAVLIAQAALARVLGETSSRSELVAEIAREQARLLAAESVLEVEVSRSDFPEPAELEGLIGEGLRIVALDLPGGACRLRLSLGRVHADLDAQWTALQAVLADLSTPDEAR